MKCPRCDSENNDASRFCGNCASPLRPAGPEAPSLTKTLEAPAQVLKPGSLVAGKYRVLEELGHGGMGVVYKAEDLKLKRFVALKFLPPDLMDSPELKERFLIEAQAAAALSHPNICVIHEVGEDEARPYIAMEFVEGETLRDRLRRGPLKAEEALAIAGQVAAGLGEAHHKGIIHRDVKSANIMVTPKGQVKVMDFGLAKMRGGSSLTKSQTTIGTVAYMSPEQALGEDLDPRTDLWSLGVVLYEMLSGELPFKGDRDVSVVYSIVHAEPRSLHVRKPPVPEAMRQVIAKALKKKRDARYGSAEEMLKDLKAYQASLQMEASGILNVRTIVRRMRRPQVALPGVAVLGILAFAGVRFFKHQSQVRWAKQVAVPELERLTAENNCWRDLIPVYRLAEKVEAIVPGEPRLAGIFAKCALRINVRTEPPGASVYLKEYMSPGSAWTLLGVSPIEGVRLPVGVFRWKVEKDGYDTVMAAASTWNGDITKPDIVVPGDFVRVLDKAGSVPAGMVRVAGAETPAGKLDDFFLDRCEVTNAQYKSFVDAGGYRNTDFWKQRFFKEGRELSWEAAIRGFVDPSGLPGPSTWQGGSYPEGEESLPVSGVSWYEAAAYAAFAGKSLPTGYHWGIGRGEYTPMVMLFQLGGFALLAPFSNFQGKGPVPVGSLGGITAYGALDMAGNVREWCSNETAQGRLIRGGAWGDNTYMYDNWSQAPAMDRSAKNGFRCALYPRPEAIPEAALAKVPSSGHPLNAAAEEATRAKPVSEAVFEVYKNQFSYDRTELKASVESRKESPDWRLEKISFDAAYGDERVLAWLFLPRNASPPYQAVVYMGGDAPVFQRSSEDIENYYEVPMFFSFLVKNGRAVLYPAVKGFFERGDDALTAIIEGNVTTHQWAEAVVQQIKDLRRSLDYLESRSDIDRSRLAFLGMSYGSMLSPLFLAVDERVRAAILLAGGFFGLGGVPRPEINIANYLGRVRCPVLMMNGRYDSIIPLETAQRPMFEGFGLPAAKKAWKLYDTDHIPPINETIRETLAWLDRFLGPVKR